MSTPKFITTNNQLDDLMYCVTSRTTALNSKYAIDLFAGLLLTATDRPAIKIKPANNGVLYINQVNTNVSTVSIYTLDGTLNGSVTLNNTQQPLATLIANTSYILMFTLTGGVSANALMARLQTFIAPTIFDVFSGPFNNTLPVTTGITTSTDAYGQFTYTFTNYQVTTGTKITLGYTSDAITSGTLTVVTTPATYMAPRSFAVSTFEVVGVEFTPLLSGLFTGTIVVGTPGAGVLAAYDTLSLPSV